MTKDNIPSGFKDYSHPNNQAVESTLALGLKPCTVLQSDPHEDTKFVTQGSPSTSDPPYDSNTSDLMIIAVRS